MVTLSEHLASPMSPSASDGRGEVAPASEGRGEVGPASDGHGEAHPASDGRGEVGPASEGRGEVGPASEGRGEVGPASEGRGEVGPASDDEERPASDGPGEDQPASDRGRGEVEEDRSLHYGGWSTMPYILANESFERLASFSLTRNFLQYLTNFYHMSQVQANSLISIWSGMTNLTPLLGAFLSDAYFGRFPIIFYSSFAGVAGMVVMTLTAGMPSLRPAKCPGTSPCTDGPTRAQLGVLISALGLLAVAAGGIRPCSIPFGYDQFDTRTEEGRKSVKNYYDWINTSGQVIAMIGITIMVYIQDVSFTIGFGICSGLMLASTVVFFLGRRRFIYATPKGSVFTDVVRSLVAAFRKRKLQLPEGEPARAYYDPPLSGVCVTRLPLTDEFKFLNKAALVEEGDLSATGECVNKWRVRSVQDIEEVKCILRVLPVAASGILCYAVLGQDFLWMNTQALAMNRYVGRFQIPAATMGIISMISNAASGPLYTHLIIPSLSKIIGHRRGITLLQRMGAGLVFSVAAMLLSGVVERWRRESTLAHNGTVSVFYLVPQLTLVGVAECFNFVAALDFYTEQFPERMRSLASALNLCICGLSGYVTSLLVTLVRHFTGGPGRRHWLDDDLSVARLDYYYYLLAFLGALNVAYFLVVSVRYRYKRVRPAEIDLERR